MATLRQMMTYRPPDIRLFQEFGGGYLGIAASAVNRAVLAFYRSRVELLKSSSWGSDPVDIPQKDLVEAYGYWTMADDMLKRLDRMEKSEREKQLALDTDESSGVVFHLVLQEHADLFAQMQIDQKRSPAFDAALDRQLKRRLDTWEKALLRTEKYGFQEDSEPFESIDDFCEERDVIEYAAMGIENLRMRETKGENHLRTLPYFDKFSRRRLKLDEIFRRVLNGRYEYAPWAELPQFWWHHSQKDLETFIRNREKRLAGK